MEQSVREIVIGNGLITGCSVCYLWWWCIVFRPGAEPAMIKAGILFVCMGILGISGLVMLLMGMQAQQSKQQLFSNNIVMAAGVIFYFVMFFVTLHFFHRQITTELLLITGWGVLALCMMNSLYGSQLLTHRAALGGCAIAAVIVILSMLCYILYYRLKAQPAFYDGMVPLLLVGLYMAGTDIKLLWG